jgi:hypothetical protein
LELYPSEKLFNASLCFPKVAYLLLADFHLESNARQAELDLAWASNVPVDDDEDF